MAVHSGRNGFTLIELLIVVAIIGILAAIAVPNFQVAMVRSKIARVQADFQSIRNALEMYRLEYTGYPPIFVTHASGDMKFAWKFLTTPLAYLGLIPLEPFRVDTIDDMYGSRLFRQGYCYAYSPCRGLESYTIVGKTAKPGYDNYILNSVGPDRDHDLHLQDYPRIRYFSTYEISNGLRSDGDIIYETHPGLNEPTLPSSPGGG